ncbi:MAG: hypothetical protein HY935_05670 [Nitrosomonadales bacterium]|nr:hypothetical protein [Nitrosomonadales bacterium]
MPLWFIFQVAKLLVLIWHKSQLFPVDGIWSGGLPTTPCVVPLWQVPQMPATLASWKLAPSQVVVDLWQVSQAEVVAI